MIRLMSINRRHLQGHRHHITIHLKAPRKKTNNMIMSNEKEKANLTSQRLKVDLSIINQNRQSIQIKEF